MSIMTANITLDEGLKAFVEADAAATGCASVSEYMRKLIEARKREKLDYDAAVVKLKRLIHTPPKSRARYQGLLREDSGQRWRQDHAARRAYR